MKLIKTKTIETVTEEITVEDGVYYFSLANFESEPFEYYRIEIDTEDDLVEIKLTKILDDYFEYSIYYNTYYSVDDLPIIAQRLFFHEKSTVEINVKEITEEEFFAVKEKVKQQL